ncbi:MAG: glycosyltransferase [Chitinispirillales bacterium]|jgi:glycosyltransferase involved in cell wall biosynthesis|nr:glycosyltransferase [Chitinispirillales bacterium]
MDKISIIIPVYNVEPYIKKCLDSVINQTYTDLEILLINDGSTDNSGNICDEYAKIDNRIRVFHKNNGGVASARNVGLKNFTGQYLGFVDPDDWIEPNMYEVLYNAIVDKNVHISVAGYFKDINTESVTMVNREKIYDCVISAKDMLLYPLKRDYYMGFCGYLWNKLFSADIFNDGNLIFDNDIKYASDVLFYTTVVTARKCTGCYIDKPIYHYYQRNSAITKSKSLNIKNDILIVYKRVEKLLNDNGYSDISYWARGFYCYHASVIAEIVRNEIKNHLDDYIETNREFPEKIERMQRLFNG